MAQRLPVKDAEPTLPVSSGAGPGLHRRSDLQRSGGSGGGEPRRRRPGSAPTSPTLRADKPAGSRARALLTSRWQLLMLVLAGLLLHSMVAKRTQPWLAASSGSLIGGVAIRQIEPTGEGGPGGESSRSRALVEQHDGAGGGQSALSSLAALVRRGAASPPPSPIPLAWIEGGTLGQWPKPYRNKTRQVVPNSISTWRCTPDAANFSLAAATHNPLLQSTEWREKYGDDVSMYKWCREGLPEEVPQLQQVLKLESRKARPERGLTVVTQLSLERFQMLDNQCSTWPLQISAVLYIPLLKGRIFSAEEPSWNKKSLDVGLAETLKFFAAMEASNSSCILDLEVVVEERCDRYSAMLYPANAARNRALVNAKTDAMLLVDVDFAVSQSLADLVRGEATYKRLMSMLHNRNAVVLPAFETQDDGEAGRQVALECVRRGKPYVVRKFEWNIVFGFHVPQYPQGHQATDYWRWIKSRGAYPVQYQIGYEPYIMMHRAYIPFYDERFRGYYWNKVQHLMHISLQNGFNFLVHPTAFVVHVPHKKPSTKWLTRKMGQKEKNHMLFDNALFHMRQMDFVPVTSWAEHCTPEAAPVLPGEDEAREVAAMKAAAERAAAEQAELLMQQHASLQEAAAAAAAKRAAEVAEAELWMSQNAEAAAAATKQRQEAALEEDAAFLAAQHQHQQQLAAAAAAGDGAADERAAQQAEAGGELDAAPGDVVEQAAAAAAAEQAAQQQAAAGAQQVAQQAGAGQAGAEQAAQQVVAAGADQAQQVAQQAVAGAQQAVQQAAETEQTEQAAQQAVAADATQAQQQVQQLATQAGEQAAAGNSQAAQQQQAAAEAGLAAQEQLAAGAGQVAQQQLAAAGSGQASQEQPAGAGAQTVQQQQPAAGGQGAAGQAAELALAGAAHSRDQQGLEAEGAEDGEGKEGTSGGLEQISGSEEEEEAAEGGGRRSEPVEELELMGGEEEEKAALGQHQPGGEAAAGEATAEQRRRQQAAGARPPCVFSRPADSSRTDDRSDRPADTGAN